jgi:predicted homoserine dehydrogenase-like protein
VADLLKRAKALEKDIHVGIIGIGSIGKGMVLQAHITPGIKGVAIADIFVERAIECAEWLGQEYRVVEDLGAMHDTIRRGKVAVTGDGSLVAQCELVDVMMEASSSVLAGGVHALTALEHQQHAVMMNYEADLMFGPYLLALARNRGLVYTGCDGDQPSVEKRLVDALRFWGFDLVMAGNMKGYLDTYSNPTAIIPEADKRNLDYKMCASYTDGTKMQIEQAVVANALGLRCDVPGMHGPRAQDVLDVFDLFDLDAIWADRQGVVDYVLGAQPSGGVFAIGYTEDEFQQFTLDWYPVRMGPGPFYVFYNPCHLGHMEAMQTVLEAVLDGTSVLKADFGFQTNVYAYAKRDLRQGENLDGIGGYACYGLIENCVDNTERPGLPVCLAEDVTLKRDVPKDSKIFMDDVNYDAARADFHLFAKAMVRSGF